MENYELICPIGKGNFGSISKIIRKSDQKVLVWKKLDYSNMSEKEKQQIVSEVNILRELKHPNIVRYYDRIIDKKHATIYIIMEYCEGGDLNQLIKRCRKSKEFIAEDIIWKIFTQIVLALHACHTKKDGKVLHRDIKASNVFLDGENNVKLGDFGLSRVLSNESNFAYSHVGTPYYMSPEQIDEMRYNEKSDIWSLGCFLYELTTLTPPFEARTQVTLAAKIKSGKVEKINIRYSEELWRVITWMLKVNQEQRPSVEDLLNVPQVCIRLRERRLKENMAKMKEIEENLQKKEIELNEKLKNIEEREKKVKEKEEELKEKEKNFSEMSKQLESLKENMKLENLKQSNYSNNYQENMINNSNSNLNNIKSYKENEIGMLLTYGNNITDINKITSSCNKQTQITEDLSNVNSNLNSIYNSNSLFPSAFQNSNFDDNHHTMNSLSNNININTSINNNNMISHSSYKSSTNMINNTQQISMSKMIPTGGGINTSTSTFNDKYNLPFSKTPNNGFNTNSSLVIQNQNLINQNNQNTLNSNSKSIQNNHNNNSSSVNISYKEFPNSPSPNVYQKANTNRVNAVKSNSKERTKIPQNYLHKKSYDMASYQKIDISTTKSNETLASKKLNPSIITKYSNSGKYLNGNTNTTNEFNNKNFNFDPSLYENDYQINQSEQNTLVKQKNNPNSNIIRRNNSSSNKITLGKRASTPKVGVSTNRNYTLYNQGETVSNRGGTNTSYHSINNNVNTPQRHGSSVVNYYYEKYIMNNNSNSKNHNYIPRKNNADPYTNKSYTSINSVIDHSSNRNQSKNKKTKIPKNVP